MKTTTAERWSNSPALKLTLANYLPQAGEATASTSITESEYARQNDVVSIIDFSKDELGRINQERKLYLKTAGEKYGQVNFLARTEDLNKLSLYAKNGEINIDEQDDEVKQMIKADIASLSQLSEQLFGGIDLARYEAIVARTRRNAQEILADESSDAALQASAARVLVQFPQADPSLVDQHIQTPPKELLAHWRPAVEKKYAELLSLVELDKESFTSEELVELFNQAIQIMATEWGLDNASTWHAKIGKKNINVDMEERTVWVPKDKTYQREKAGGLLIHEIGGHLLRNLVGEKSGNPLLEAGMPKRSIDEEALFVLFEQILSGKATESGLAYYMAVGLANGALNNPKIPLDNLEQPVLDYLAVTKKHTLTSTETTANITRVRRITRGMPSFVIDGELHQVTYNADLKYANGQANAKLFLEQNMNNPKAVDDVMLGKFAFSDDEQMEYAKAHSSHARQLTVPSAI